MAEEKNISAKKWLWRLILTWFGVEILTIVAILSMSDGNSKDSFVMASLVGVALALISAFYTISAMKRELNLETIK